ncbi:hypothetical protein V6N12_010005 [Hibiscus sabdariffa]|uniref:RNase H type-1 domain-containing protein n=1 Tax=Hibiscus sabdariffa TaxID=183260 RepID=A0ABR2ECE3_9ROSI
MSDSLNTIIHFLGEKAKGVHFVLADPDRDTKVDTRVKNLRDVQNARKAMAMSSSGAWAIINRRLLQIDTLARGVRKKAKDLHKACGLLRRVTDKDNVKIFAWRLGKEGLPTGNRIRAVGLGTGLFPFCQTSIETPLQAFRDCDDAREALLLADVIPSLANSSVSDPLPWLEEAASQLSQPALGCFVTLLWNLWNRRNRWIHDQQLQPIWATVMTASMIHQDFLSVSRHPASTPALRPAAWSPPPPPRTITLNIDGSFDADNGAGIGVVARDSSGHVLCGLAQHSASPTEAEFAKHAALLAGLQLVLDHGWSSVLIEMDSAQTVNRLSRPSYSAPLHSSVCEPSCSHS